VHTARCAGPSVGERLNRKFVAPNDLWTKSSGAGRANVGFFFRTIVVA